MTRRMFSSTRKCWPSSFFGARGLIRGSRGRRRARVLLDLPLELRLAFAAREGERREGVHDVGRLVRLPADGLGGEVGRVGLGEDPLGGDLARRDAELGAFL